MTPSITYNDKSLPANFWNKISVRGECWDWIGASHESGYGLFRIGGKMKRTHRIVYELVNGPIPIGLQIDHLCRNTRCCNPSHLEAVTAKVNVQRSTVPQSSRNRAAMITECPQGHPYSIENTIFQATRGGPKTSRKCRICSAASTARWRAKTASSSSSK